MIMRAAPGASPKLEIDADSPHSTALLGDRFVPI